MSGSLKRIITALVLTLIAIAIAVAEHFGIGLVRYVGLLLVLIMIAEFIVCIAKTPNETLSKKGNWILVCLFLLWLIFMLVAINYVGKKPEIVLLLLLIICAADIGAWFFGPLLKSSKMWENISPAKTWAGQIAGIVCGTAAAILFGIIFKHAFIPELLWFGIGISLLSQYGDLTASWIKRRLKIKDFGSLLPGHGGFLDRFDGWIYVLPLAWILAI